MCSFAWFFVAFSTPAGSSLVFAEQIIPHESAHQNQWRTMYIASALILVVSWFHYWLSGLVIFTNRAFAAFKVLFLLVLIFAGIVRAIIQRHSIPWFRGFTTDFNDNISFQDKGLALFLVLQSYQGWQSASKNTTLMVSSG